MTEKRRALLLAALLFFAIVTSAGASAWTRGRDAMIASDAAMARGDARAALVCAKDAAQARVPFSPYPERGRARLAELARDAEARSDFDGAVLALRALRAACASSSIGAPEACAKEADDGIARVAARTGVAAFAPADEIAPPVWLPLVVIAAAVAAVVLAARSSR